MENKISIWLQPQPKLKAEIFTIIKNFSKKYKVYSDLRSYKGPHITILDINNPKQNFRTLVNLLDRVIEPTKPFNLKVNGIGYFMKLHESGKRNYVIYLKVKKNKELKRLKKLVDSEFPEQLLRYVRINREYIPHITITHKELDKKRFYLALKEYRNLKFFRNFKVDKIVISKYNNKTKKDTINYVNLNKK